MFSTFVTLALVLVPALTRVAAFEVYYPTEVGACQALDFAWDGTAKWPIDAVVVDPEDPCADDPLIDLGELEATSANPIVKFKPGTVIQISLLDADDDEAWSAPITVVESDDYSCLSKKVAASLSASALSAAATSSSTVASSSVVEDDATTTALVITPEETSSTASEADATSSSGAVPVGAVGSDDFSDGAGAVAVPIVLLAASLASVLLL